MPLKFLKVIAQENLPGHLFDPVASTPKQREWERDFGVADIVVTYEIDCSNWTARGSGGEALALVDERAWKEHLDNLVSAVRTRLEGLSG